MRVGLFGGTFDPPHIGHLIAAQDAHRALDLDHLLFVPAGEPPHKRGRSITPAPIRLAMLEAAIAGDDRFAICNLELERPGPSYTADTLRQLHSERPQRDLFLLLGADQVRELDTWREPQEVARLARIVLLSRAGVATLGAQQMLVTREVPVTRIDVSASDIRRRVLAGESIRYLVPRAVEDIVYHQRLYQTVVPNGNAQGGVTI